MNGLSGKQSPIRDSASVSTACLQFNQNKKANLQAQNNAGW
jgi:hypothetical protein